MIPRRTWLKSGKPPKRTAYLPRSTKPIAKRGPAKARREKAYKAFLSSAAWKRIRKAKLAEQPTCELMLTGCEWDERLTVHHVRYTRFGGQEQMADLQTACRSCHNRHHATAGKRIR